MSTFVGIDDTDSVDGMCTTFLGLEIIASLPDGVDLIGRPRLVRLNPNVPWKTRGNGAVSFEVGGGRGDPFPTGEFDGKVILAYPQSSHGTGDIGQMADVLSELIENSSHHDREGTDPGLVISPGPLPASLYWTGVRDLHDIATVRDVLDAHGCTVRTWGNGRGIIGAACAIAWPAEGRTFEATAYRTRDRWGTPREFDRSALEALDREFGTFNTYDHGSGRVLAVPNTPCPVLMGVRGVVPGDAERALLSVRTERSLGRVLWLTNHGTDDHVTRVDSLSSVRMFLSVEVSGVVTSEPRTIRGGHVILTIGDPTAPVDLAAYEPTGDLRSIVAELREGDRVTALGGVRDDPLTINLEKLRIDSTVDRYIKRENPLCRACGKRMKSKGRDAGYRCQVCGDTATEEDAPRVAIPPPGTGWYEASPSAQRHLTKPLVMFDRC